MFDRIGSSELQEAVVNNALAVGSAFKIYVPHTTPPKIKILIITGKNNTHYSCCYVFVNSDVNTNVINSPELEKLQYPIAASDHSFLDHNSYVDCSQLFEIDLVTLGNRVREKYERYLGAVPAKTLLDLQTKVSEAQTIRDDLKSKFGLSIL